MPKKNCRGLFCYFRWNPQRESITFILHCFRISFASRVILHLVFSVYLFYIYKCRSLDKVPQYGVAKNIIIFLGDGLGLPTVTTARFLKAQRNNAPVHQAWLSFEHFPGLGLSQVQLKNYAHFQQKENQLTKLVGFILNKFTHFCRLIMRTEWLQIRQELQLLYCVVRKSISTLLESTRMSSFGTAPM